MPAGVALQPGSGELIVANVGQADHRDLKNPLRSDPLTTISSSAATTAECPGPAQDEQELNPNIAQ